MPRELTKTEFGLFESHLFRLDPEAKRLRFQNGAGDSLIPTYISKITQEPNHKILAILDKASVVGAVHIAFDAKIAELAFSVETNYRKQGFARKLFAGALAAIEPQGVKTIYTSCLSENTSMIRLARSYNMSIERSGMDSEAFLTLF
jgi:RimJ/RimL family protein N-acetyltransferase